MRLEWPVVPVCLGIVVAAVVAAVVAVAAGEEWECLALGAALETVGEAAAAEEAPVAEDPMTGLCYHHTLGDHKEPQASEIFKVQINNCR